MNDRRLDTRFLLPERADARATLRPGCPVQLVNVSAGGALIEGPRPVRPGARVLLQVATPQRTFSIAAYVTRCLVWSLDPLEGVLYRGALRFEHRIEWCWGEPSRLGHEVPESARPVTRRIGQAIPTQPDEPAQSRARGPK